MCENATINSENLLMYLGNSPLTVDITSAAQEQQSEHMLNTLVSGTTYRYFVPTFK